MVLFCSRPYQLVTVTQLIHCSNPTPRSNSVWVPLYNLSIDCIENVVLSSSDLIVSLLLRVHLMLWSVVYRTVA
jgi:hypothetical protein